MHNLLRSGESISLYMKCSSSEVVKSSCTYTILVLCGTPDTFNAGRSRGEERIQIPQIREPGGSVPPPPFFFSMQQK